MALPTPTSTGNSGTRLLSVPASGNSFNSAGTSPISTTWKLIVRKSTPLLAKYPEVASALKNKLSAWCYQMQLPGLPGDALNVQEKKWHDFYFGKE